MLLDCHLFCLGPTDLTTSVQSLDKPSLGNLDKAIVSPSHPANVARCNDNHSCYAGLRMLNSFFILTDSENSFSVSVGAPYMITVNYSSCLSVGSLCINASMVVTTKVIVHLLNFFTDC